MHVCMHMMVAAACTRRHAHLRGGPKHMELHCTVRDPRNDNANNDNTDDNDMFNNIDSNMIVT